MSVRVRLSIYNKVYRKPVNVCIIMNSFMNSLPLFPRPFINHSLLITFLELACKLTDCPYSSETSTTSKSSISIVLLAVILAISKN